MIRTAIPLGYLFIVLFLGTALLTGSALAVWGLLRRRRATLIVGSTMVFGVLGLFIAQLVFDSSTEWNPSITEDSRVVGTWADDRETITLRADHTVDYRSDTEGFSGSWSRDDWNLHLRAEGVNKTMRFISFRDALRLLTNPPDDPDMWDGDLGLIRE
jgi:hypothetical protein